MLRTYTRISLRQQLQKLGEHTMSTVGYNLNRELPRTKLPIDRAWVYPVPLLLSRRFLSNSRNDVLALTPVDPAAPVLHIRWFYATDIPLQMPEYYKYEQTGTPMKFTPFSEFDSERLETEYQKLMDGAKYQNVIPVNEDYLFEVQLSERRMSPVYWEAAIYEIRRGTWFTNEGQPVEESLAEELEDGYLKMKPYESSEGTKNPLLKKKFQHDVYNIKGEQRVLYCGDKSAYLLEKGYGGPLQISILNAVKSLPAIGAQLQLRGYQPKVKDQQSKDKDLGIEGLGSLMQLEITNVFGEGGDSTAKDEDAARKAMELEIEQDYKAEKNQSNGDRDIDHLIFCVHGIGQMLGTKFQNVNFVHTVNLMRKNLKKVYADNKDFQQLLGEKSNCRTQVLPISWRHKVQFNTMDDISDTLPSLNDITGNEARPLRNLLGSVLFDVLLYYEPRYLEQIYHEVVRDANKQFAMFRDRHPEFTGKVSIVGHSLGSAIMMDILALQPDTVNPKSEDPMHLHFKVENYFGIGSPVGLFNLLKGHNIGPRSLMGPSTEGLKTLACDNYYNIFHPCDPVGFRVEPLIKKEFKSFEPESVPFLIEDFNKQLSLWAQMSDDFRNKMLNSAVSTWSNVASSGLVSSFKAHVEEAQQGAEEQKKGKVVDLTPGQLEILSAMNYNGRVDYALQQGYLDLSIVSGLSAHVSYFEDENIAAFILKEVMIKHEKVTQKQVRTLVN